MDKEKEKKTPQSKKQIEHTVKELTEDVIANLGYEIWDVEYYNDGLEWLLEITLENPAGALISFEDCEKVTRAVAPILDKADPIKNSYCLAVGSPGLNRELKNTDHLQKYVDKEVTLKLFAKNEQAGDKSFNAVLKEIGDQKKDFLFELSGKQKIALTKKEIAHIYAHEPIL